MTNYKQLCFDLVELGSSPARSVSELAERMSQVMDLADRAHAALAEPEPEGPTDEELKQWQRDCASKTTLRAATHYWALGVPTDLANDLVRAALARWGNHPGSPDSSPAAGEVAELVDLIRQNVALAWEPAACMLGSMTAGELTRAAELLEQLNPPQPVPVSERLPGPGDCDTEGRCWTWAIGTWRLSRINRSFHTHWLPAHALPKPS